MSKEAPNLLRSFLEVKVNNVVPEMEKILNMPDGLAEKITTNIPLGEALILRTNRVVLKNDAGVIRESDVRRIQKTIFERPKYGAYCKIPGLGHA